MKKQKITFTCVLVSLLCSLQMKAQNCNSTALFKKGAELEYHTYLPKQGLFGKKNKFFETTRLIFIVDQVLDSAGATYSYITKRGISAEREKNSYEKKYVISCKEGKIYMPVDFYHSDTIFLSDVYPGLRKKTIYSASNLQAPAIQYFSIDPAKSEFNFVNKTYTTNIMMQNYGWGEYYKGSNVTGSPGASTHYETSGSLSKNEMVTVTSIKKSSVKGREKVEASEQMYDCANVQLEFDYEITSHKKAKGPEPNMEGKTLTYAGNIYYNETIGIVKVTADKNNAGYFELYSIKVPK